PLDVVRLGQRLARAVTGKEVDALAERFGHLRDLGHLWQWGALPEASVVHHLRLARLIPSDLLDAVVELGRVAVGIVDVDVPVAARHVAPDALDRDLVPLEVGVGIDDLAQAAALPGDLVDGDLGRELPVGAEVHHLFVEEHERVMIRAVAHEVAPRIAEIRVLGEPGRLREVERVGEPEAEQVRVELDALRELEDIEPEVAEPPELEGPRQHHASDVVALGDGCHGSSPFYEARIRKTPSRFTRGVLSSPRGSRGATASNVSPKNSIEGTGSRR